MKKNSQHRRKTNEKGGRNIFHSLQAFGKLSQSQWERLAESVNNPSWQSESWDSDDFDDDPLLYGIYVSDKKHYLFRDYESGLKAIAWMNDHGYYITFIIHLDNLLFGQHKINLPTADDLTRIRDRFIEDVFTLGWLDEMLPIPSFERDPTREKAFEIIGHFYDSLKIQRVDPAVDITGLTHDQIQAYAYVLNRGKWSNGRQHFNTIQNPDRPHPKTFLESCCLESLVKADSGKTVTSVRINCYDKEAMFRSVMDDPEKKYKPSPKKVEAAKGIFRVEVQCWTPYIKNLLDRHIITSRNISDIITPDFSRMILSQYLQQFGGTSDYWKLSTADRKIRTSTKKIEAPSMRMKLRQFLKLLQATYESNEKMLPLDEALRTVANQMGIGMETVGEYRQRLLELNINPITLPNDSNVKHLPNLLSLVLAQYPQTAEREEKSIEH